MPDSQWLSLLGTPFTVGFGILLVGVVSLLAWSAIQRSNFKRPVIVLEIIRCLLAIMIAITLNQPEWLQQFFPKAAPVVAVLWDNSQSMTTEDIISSADRAISRDEWLKPYLSDDVWSKVDSEVTIVKQPFDSQAHGNSASDLNGALERVNEKHKNLRGVVMFSDGDWNDGKSPTNAATKLRLRGVPVYTVAVGSDQALPDLEIASLDAPTFGIVNKPTRIPYVIESTLPRKTTTTVVLTSSDGSQYQQDVVIGANQRYEGAIVWFPKDQGEYSLTLNVPAQEDEINLKNNILSVPISVRQESIKMLIVESFPRWEYRYLRNALLRDPGVDVKTLLFHPQIENLGGGLDYLSEFPNLEELARFDVIMLGDVGVTSGQLTLEQCRMIRGVVENQATGLVLLPGFRGNHYSLLQTPLEGLYPVQLDAVQINGWGSHIPAQLQLTEAGKTSLLTKLGDMADLNASIWRALPGFQWYAPVERAKSGTQILAVHGSASNHHGRIPVMVTKTFGTGKILFMGTDGAWRWREGVEDKYHYRFWGQVARWMAYQRNMSGGENMRLYYSPDRPKSGQTIVLNANISDSFGEPLRRGNVKVQLTSPSGSTQQINLAPPEGDSEWGLFTGAFATDEPGEYDVVMTCRENRSTLETKLSVIGAKRERIGKPINSESLREIATITDGKMLDTTNIRQIFQEVANLPGPEPSLRRIRLWSHPAWAGSVLVLLCVFWIGRKMNGMI